jgi:hypothetical protein
MMRHRKKRLAASSNPAFFGDTMTLRRPMIGFPQSRCPTEQINNRDLANHRG